MIHLIGVAYSDYTDGKIVGFRILDTRQNGARNIAYTDCLKAVSGSDFPIIMGIKYDFKANILVGSNGSLDRYPKISLIKGIVKDSIVILGESKDKGYLLCNGSGSVKFIPTREAIEMCKMIGIANGKICTRGNTEYISPISGRYAPVSDKTIQSLMGV